MAIVIVVEDGTGVADANSYVTVDGARAYALNRGVTLSTDDDVVAAQLVRATDYLEALEFKGAKVDEGQSLNFPRSNIYINCKLLDSATIPKKLISAQCQLVIEQFNGLELQQTTTPDMFVIEETVASLTEKYANPVQTGVLPTFTAVNALLASLIGGITGSATFSIVRV